MPPVGHSVTSPSSANRWLHCTPSARLNAVAQQSSEAAAEGTAAHELAEYKVRTFLGEKLKRPTSDYDCDEMEEATDDYLFFIREKLAAAKETCEDPAIFVEQRIDFSRYVPNGYGCTDCCIVADETMYIIDLKYGKGIVVDAEENPQMKIYALGCLELFSELFDIQRVSMNIFQPRRENISTWETSVEDLRTWADEVLAPKAKEAYEGNGEFVPGDWCLFCKVAPRCRARADSCLALARMEFKPGPLLSDEELGEVMEKADQISKWAGDIMAYCQEQAIDHGRHFPGYKVVQGRSIRKFSDTDAVAQAARDAGYTDSDIFTTSLITLTAFERLMGKKKFQDTLGDYVTKTTPKLVLVPESDKRPEIQVDSAMNDFKGEYDNG